VADVRDPLVLGPTWHERVWLSVRLYPLPIGVASLDVFLFDIYIDLYNHLVWTFNNIDLYLYTYDLPGEPALHLCI